jgi:hypothetical protein
MPPKIKTAGKANQTALALKESTKRKIGKEDVVDEDSEDDSDTPVLVHNPKRSRTTKKDDETLIYIGRGAYKYQNLPTCDKSRDSKAFTKWTERGHKASQSDLDILITLRRVIDMVSAVLLASGDYSGIEEDDLLFIMTAQVLSPPVGKSAVKLYKPTVLLELKNNSNGILVALNSKGSEVNVDQLLNIFQKEISFVVGKAKGLKTDITLMGGKNQPMISIAGQNANAGISTFDMVLERFFNQQLQCLMSHTACYLSNTFDHLTTATTSKRDLHIADLKRLTKTKTTGFSNTAGNEAQGKIEAALLTFADEEIRPLKYKNKSLGQQDISDFSNFSSHIIRNNNSNSFDNNQGSNVSESSTGIGGCNSYLLSNSNSGTSRGGGYDSRDRDLYSNSNSGSSRGGGYDSRDRDSYSNSNSGSSRGGGYDSRDRDLYSNSNSGSSRGGGYDSRDRDLYSNSNSGSSRGGGYDSRDLKPYTTLDSMGNRHFLPHYYDSQSDSDGDGDDDQRPTLVCSYVNAKTLLPCSCIAYVPGLNRGMCYNVGCYHDRDDHELSNNIDKLGSKPLKKAPDAASLDAVKKKDEEEEEEDDGEMSNSSESSSEVRA